MQGLILSTLQEEYTKQYVIECDNAEWIGMADAMTNCAASLNTGPAAGLTRGAFEQSSSDALFGTGFGRFEFEVNAQFGSTPQVSPPQVYRYRPNGADRWRRRSRRQWLRLRPLPSQ